MADRPLRPATDRRLGRPLPHQLPNRTQAAPKAPHGFGPQSICGISPSFPGLSPTSGYIPTRYSPVRHSPCRACDLHVLSMPPAFALSQDQTLRFISKTRPKPGPADALSIRLRSPLSIQRSPFSHYPCSQTLITGSDAQDTTTACACFQKTDAIVKDPPLPDRCARVGTAPGRQRAAPHRCGAKEHVPEGTRSGICSRTALHFRKPGTTPKGVITKLEGATAPLQET